MSVIVHIISLETGSAGLCTELHITLTFGEFSRRFYAKQLTISPSHQSKYVQQGMLVFLKPTKVSKLLNICIESSLGKLNTDQPLSITYIFILSVDNFICVTIVQIIALKYILINQPDTNLIVVYPCQSLILDRLGLLINNHYHTLSYNNQYESMTHRIGHYALMVSHGKH